MLSLGELDEIVFQVLVKRIHGKRRFQRPIQEETIARLCGAVKAVFDQEPVMLRVHSNINIVGDIHGNIDDLLRIFERMRYPPATRYLFLGDYVDRKDLSTEVLLLLFTLKLKFPDNIYLLRGNHETESLSRCYGFFREVSSKYSESAYLAFVDVFVSLLICAIVGQRIFCAHGGISPELTALEELEKLPKPIDFSTPGIFTDIVWSDPSNDVASYAPNSRGTGYLFGSAPLLEFLKANHLDMMIRSHGMCYLFNQIITVTVFTETVAFLNDYDQNDHASSSMI